MTVCTSVWYETRWTGGDVECKALKNKNNSIAPREHDAIRAPARRLRISRRAFMPLYLLLLSPVLLGIVRDGAVI